MMMPLVHRVATVAPFELDAVAYDAVNRADLDDLHILFDLVLRHDFLLRSISYTEIASAKRLSGQKALAWASAPHYGVFHRFEPFHVRAQRLLAIKSDASFTRTGVGWIII
jgi:hypothetical protein